MVNLNVRAELRRQYYEERSYSVHLDDSRHWGANDLRVKVPRSPMSPATPHPQTSSDV
jgi:hypothetical protein